ncbi:MAG: phage holin family protein [Thermodesulfobacteriota bacterium]
MTRTLFRLAVVALGVTLASFLVPGIEVAGAWPAVKAAVALGFLNIFIKPVLLLLTLPITLITLGFFALVINGLMLWLAGGIITGFDVAGFLPATAGGIVISVINLFFEHALWD